MVQGWMASSPGSPVTMQCENKTGETSLVVHRLRLDLPVQEVRELRSHMPHGRKSIKQKQHCNTFNKDFLKNV